MCIQLCGVLLFTKKRLYYVRKFFFTKNELITGYGKNYITNEEKYPENIDAARYRNIYCMFHLLGRSILDDHFISESRQIRTNILDNVDFILNSGLFNTKEIVATVVLKCGLNFYRMVWRLYKKIQ